MEIPDAVNDAVRMLFDRNSDGSTTIAAFRRRVHYNSLCNYWSINWCGMYVGIEPDGYTHT